VPSDSSPTKEGAPAKFIFIPALHVGAAGMHCSSARRGMLRVSFARALLPAPERGLPDLQDVPTRPAEGSELPAAGAAGRAAQVAGGWPGLGGRKLAARRRMTAWVVSSIVLVSGTLMLIDLACVAPRVDEEAGWNRATTRSYLLSLIFSLVVGDLCKVLALTVVSTALLPGILSPRAHVLRFLFRGLAKVLDRIT
jgi:hypothetical protein